MRRGNRKKIRSQIAIYDHLKNGKVTIIMNDYPSIAAVDLGSNSFHLWWQEGRWLFASLTQRKAARLFS